MSSNATDLQNRLILAVERKYPLSRIWRQNCGSAYPITTFKRALEFIKRDIMPPWFRPVQYGVVGQGDVGGWIHINGVAVVCHIEVKIGKDTQREAQEKFEATVKRCGGIYVIAHDLEGGMAALAEAVTALRSSS
jgi:hypothetical protein